ncbi:aminoglycoside phosphotransferase family protein [Arthrobacter sp. 35W]|uniref:aminoglycoside phosphotransferase family protein n=1 Tax=Arthrobacter sp. 35W TaxID=1132441 RepID=UPI00041FFE9F|nr:aminoglycoside phosphotransferase family protein [Arthrobacter sp. 35W]
MPDMPPAETSIDPHRVRALLAAQHPDLAGLPLEPLANGWDNTLFRLGTEFTVRLPRRAAAVPLILHEHRWLPQLAAATTVPVPVPVRLGAPSPAFEWPWTITRWFDGDDLLGLPVAERTALAVELAGFVADIHQEAPADAPRNPVRGTPLSSRDEAFRGRLELAGMPDPGPLLASWRESLAAPVFAGPAQWIHGDLHPGNILAKDGRLSAVIDFGDLGRGDPATDLATAWLTFDGAGRRLFMERVDELTGTDAATWLRARGWALNIGTALLAHSDDNPALYALGRHAVDAVLGS